MFITVQAHQYAAYSHLLDQYFRLRKRVFSDQLGWDVPVFGESEMDCYDRLKPVYLFWCDIDKKILFGGVRLMPTTGPTLLYDVFRKTFPDAVELRAPGIWEATRLCIDEQTLTLHKPGISPAKAFSLMMLAICDCALEHGIHTIMTNYEPHMARVYRRAGASVQEFGRADGYGKSPVCCGGVEISHEVQERMHLALGVSQPLIQTQAGRSMPASVLAEAA